MKIVVTGGAGFIGSHLCEALVAKGHEVICLDNLITGSRDNLKNLEGHPRFTFLFHDVIQPLRLEAEAILHLASPASPVGYRTYPIETMKVNSIGTHNLIEEAHRLRARFLLASTSEAYGNPLVHPQREDYWGNVNPLGPRACYDESKRYAEALTMEYIRSFGLDARIVRIFNTFGPRNQLDDGRVVPNFLTRALRGEPLVVYGDGSQTRSFCYVSDLVEGIQLALFSSRARGEVINLGNPEEFTIREFAELVLRLTGSSSPIIYQPLPPDREGDPHRRQPDITKARQLLGWEPVVPVEEGLKRTIKWFKEVLQPRSVD